MYLLICFWIIFGKNSWMNNIFARRQTFATPTSINWKHWKKWQNLIFYIKLQYYCQSVSQFSRSVVSDSLQPHESQHARPPCPSPAPGVYANSCPSSQWWHPAISSSVIPFSSYPQSPPASGSFPMSQLFSWGGQSIGVSASASVLPMNTQDWSPLGGYILKTDPKSQSV